LPKALKKLSSLINLAGTYITKNAHDVAENLKAIYINKHVKIVTLDVKDVYVNLLVQGILHSKEEIGSQKKKEPATTKTANTNSSTQKEIGNHYIS
jgi:hypothetical protein